MRIVGKIERPCQPDNAVKIHTSLRQTLVFGSSIMHVVLEVTTRGQTMRADLLHLSVSQ